jgi:hypothetical protein
MTLVVQLGNSVGAYGHHHHQQHQHYHHHVIHLSHSLNAIGPALLSVRKMVLHGVMC